MARPFRLETVARLREARRDAVRAQLADALRAAAVLEGRQADLRERFVELMEQRKLAAETANTVWLLNAGRYELVLRADEKSLKENVAAIEIEIDRRRMAVAEAEREVRVLELLREKHRREEQIEQAKREARRLDEFASIRAFAANTATPPLT